MGYGVIGSPTDSGSVSLGSSPGTPAVRSLHHREVSRAPSSSGLGRRPLKAVAAVRIRSGLHLYTPRFPGVAGFPRTAPRSTTFDVGHIWGTAAATCAASRASATSSSWSGNRCPYRSSVIVADLCPSIVCTTFTFAGRDSQRRGRVPKLVRVHALDADAVGRRGERRPLEHLGPQRHPSRRRTRARPVTCLRRARRVRRRGTGGSAPNVARAPSACPRPGGRGRPLPTR